MSNINLLYSSRVMGVILRLTDRNLPATLIDPGRLKIPRAQAYRFDATRNGGHSSP